MCPCLSQAPHSVTSVSTVNAGAASERPFQLIRSTSDLCLLHPQEAGSVLGPRWPLRLRSSHSSQTGPFSGPVATSFLLPLTVWPEDTFTASLLQLPTLRIAASFLLASQKPFSPTV